jgi:uncharacterized LabA/DUF88 family protein
MSPDTRLYDDPGSVPRVAIFIDGSNLYHSLEENCNRYDLDFAAFSSKLCDGRHHFRTYYYNLLRDPNRNPQAYHDQQKFLTALYSTPYLEVRLGSSKMRGDVPVEKGIDIMLATDLLRIAWDNLYDVAILVSGDGDFSYAVQAVKDMGKHVEVAAFQANLSMELAQVVDNRELFTPDYFNELWSRRHAGDKASEPYANGGRRHPRTAKASAENQVERLRPSDFVSREEDRE